MKTHIAFLRGINVNGKRKVPMQSLRALCESLGLKDVKTYIQSGNIVFKSSRQKTTSLETLLINAIEKEYEFEVPVIVKTIDEVEDILEQNPYKNKEELDANRVYFVLFNEVIIEEFLQKLEAETFVNEEFHVGENCIYLKCKIGYGKAKLDNNFIERKLKITATTRNYRTMNKLVELAN